MPGILLDRFNITDLTLLSKFLKRPNSKGFTTLGKMVMEARPLREDQCPCFEPTARVLLSSSQVLGLDTCCRGSWEFGTGVVDARWLKGGALEGLPGASALLTVLEHCSHIIDASFP